MSDREKETGGEKGVQEKKKGLWRNATQPPDLPMKADEVKEQNPLIPA
jgi:hypothetical protein